VSLFGIHTNGLVYGLVGGVGLILAVALSAILIGLIVFRGVKKKVSSRTVLIVTATLCGIVGGFVVIGVVAFCIAAWMVATQCC